jgi:hypothetical protein
MPTRKQRLWSGFVMVMSVALISLVGVKPILTPDGRSCS